MAEEITAAGGEAMANTADITDTEQVNGMVDDAVQRWGTVDILINNAGILRDRSVSKIELSDFRTVLDVHLMGSVHCSKASTPRSELPSQRP